MTLMFNKKLPYLKLDKTNSIQFLMSISNSKKGSLVRTLDIEDRIHPPHIREDEKLILPIRYFIP